MGRVLVPEAAYRGRFAVIPKRMPRTRRVDCSEPGIARRRRGSGFEYLHEDGTLVRDPAVLERIESLAIPPAWRDVWICHDPRGHIQATGIDQAGRKQYRYHDDWRRRRDAAKFNEMVAFAQALPRLRARVARDLRRDQLDERRVLACAVRLLDIGLFRIGSEDYAEQNGSYGLTTILKRHVRISGESIVFDYPAKSGRRRLQQIADPRVREVVQELKGRRGGAELLAYRRDSRWVRAHAEDVNAYIKAATDGDFTAKDFRTWNATALFAVALSARARSARSKTGRMAAVRSAVRDVSSYLGNTPAVCRSSYIDPRVLDRFRAGLTLSDEVLARAMPGLAEPADRYRVSEPVREAVLDLIDGDEDSAATERLAA